MIPQLVVEKRPHASMTLLDPLWCVKCTEEAGRTGPKDQEELIAFYPQAAKQPS
jgi:hypothetical protein